MYLNIDKQLKEQLQQEAKQKGLSLTSYIRMLLKERNKNEKQTVFEATE